MSTQDSAGFTSILWPDQVSRLGAQISADTVTDLALGSLFGAVGASSEATAQALRPTLATPGQVLWRQQVFLGLEDEALRSGVEQFLKGLAASSSSEGLTAKARYPWEAALWHLDAVVKYLRRDCVRRGAPRANWH